MYFFLTAYILFRLADADSSTGWLSGHRRLCAKKTSTHLQAMLLPSKEQLLALPLLLAASEAMACPSPHHLHLRRQLLCARRSGAGLF